MFAEAATRSLHTMMGESQILAADLSANERWLARLVVREGTGVLYFELFEMSYTEPMLIQQQRIGRSLVPQAEILFSADDNLVSVNTQFELMILDVSTAQAQARQFNSIPA